VNTNAIVFGLALIGVGLFGFVETGSKHPTALIPAGIGLVIGACGVLAFKDSLRKHVMHAAAAVGVLGFLATVMSIPQVLTMMSGGEVERPQAAVAKAATCALCLIFTGFCVQSFVSARLARKAANSDGSEPQSSATSTTTPR
jgi:hypothetical protein